MRASLYKFSRDSIAPASIDEQPSFEVWIVRLEGYKQQFCQSRSWIVLGGRVSLRYITKIYLYIPSISLPSRARGIALAWTRVGVGKFSFATAWSNLESKPRALKLEAGFPVLETLTAAGISSLLSFRFMTASLSSYHECGCETLEINSTHGNDRAEHLAPRYRAFLVPVK